MKNTLHLQHNVGHKSFYDISNLWKKKRATVFFVLCTFLVAIGIFLFEQYDASALATSAVWDDADNGDDVLSNGDTLTITLDAPTDQPGGTGVQTRAQVDSMFAFERPLGADYTGQWISTTQFRITIVDATGGTAQIGDDVTRQTVSSFIFQLDTGGKGFIKPVGVATNSTDFIFVADQTNSNVQIFDSDGNFAGALDTTGGTPFVDPFGVATNSTDFIFVADFDKNNVQIFDSDGNFAGALSTAGGTPFEDPLGVATNSTDFIFVTYFNKNNVRIFDSDGNFAGALSTAGGTPFASPVGVATNSTDFIFVADQTNSNVQIFDSDGNFAGALSTAGGKPFASPFGVATNSTDFIFVSDLVADNVQIFDSNGNFVAAQPTTGGTAFADPQLITVDSDDRLIVPNDGPGRVQAFGPASIQNAAETALTFTNTITTTGDFGVQLNALTAVWDDADDADSILSNGDTLTITFDAPTDQPGGTGVQTRAQVDSMFAFERPLGADYTGQWISTTQFRITIVDATGGTAQIGDDVTRQTVSSFIFQLDTTDGTPFADPAGVATNSTDFIFVSDETNSNVQIFDSDGNFAGALDTTGGTPFAGPFGVATNSTDFIFVSDETNSNVQIFDSDGNFAGALSTAGGKPFAGPFGVATNSTDFIFVADQTNSNVQIFDSDGNFAGALSTAGSMGFSGPFGVATNSTDFIFVADEFSANVQIFDPDGNFAGALSTGVGTPFSGPVGVATNSTDFIFVSDQTNSNVQIFDSNGNFVAAQPTTGGMGFADPQLITVDSDDRLIVPDIGLDIVQAFGPASIQNAAETIQAFTNTITTTGDFGEANPTLAGQAYVADDPDDGDAVYGTGDTFLINFDIPTNATNSGTMTEAELLANFTFSPAFGGSADISGVWAADSQSLTVTVDLADTENPVIGAATVAAAGTTNIASVGGSTAGSLLVGTSDPLSGDFGEANPTLAGQAYVADDPDDGDAVYGTGDTFLINLDIPTNATNSGTMTEAELLANFTFSPAFGGSADISGVWAADSQSLTVTVDLADTENPVIGAATVAAAGTTNIASAGGTLAAHLIVGTSDPLSGDFGAITSSGGRSKTPPSFTTGFSDGEHPLEINGIAIFTDKTDGNDNDDDDNMPIVMKQGDTVTIKTSVYSGYGSGTITHADVFLNRQGDSTIIQNPKKNTSVSYDKGDTAITDAYGIMDSATAAKSVENGKAVFTFEIIFSDEMPLSDVVIRVWNDDRRAAHLHADDVLQVVASPEQQTSGSSVPELILENNTETSDDTANTNLKQTQGDDDDDYNAKDGEIMINRWAGYDSESATDDQMLNALVVGFRQTDNSQEEEETSTTKITIPDWIKKSLVKLYVSEQITYEEFKTVMQYMYDSGKLSL